MPRPRARAPLQVFATDLNVVGIEHARAGVYGKGITQDVSPERLQRFFVEVDGSYRISKHIRDMCVFARQNVLTDPPFSRLDMIACRNLLIYMDPVLQQQMLPIMHYALRPEGYLWLGASETIGLHRDLFEVEDAHHKIYMRKGSGRRMAITPSVARALELPEPVTDRPPASRPLPTAEPQREADRLLLGRYAPPGVLVDLQLEVQQFRGDTGAYLLPAPGRASLNLLKMLRDGLLVAVRGAIQRVRREWAPVREEGLRVRSDGGFHDVSIVVIPVGERGDPKAQLLLLFEEPGEGIAAQAREGRERAKAPRAAKDAAQGLPAKAQVERLKRELAATREYLQSVIEQQETANEELQAANEEAQSSNEELQSVNEELQTSREEIQSSNEELATVNDELQSRNDELAQSNADFANLLASVSMPIIMLDRSMRIRRFTPAAAELFGLIAGDVGRPLANIKLGLDLADLDESLRQVLVHRDQVEHEVRDARGRWHLLRIRRYVSGDQVEGAVLALVDIDEIKRHDAVLRESEQRFVTLANSAPVLMWMDDPRGLVFVNRAFASFAGIDSGELAPGEWARYLHSDDSEICTQAIEAARERREPFECLVRMRRADGEWRWMKVAGAPRAGQDGGAAGYVGSAADVTELKEAEAALVNADRAKNEFLGTLGHELRNPLAAMSNAAYLISELSREEPATRRALAIIERQTRNMARIVEDLLDISRITQGKIQLRTELTDLRVVAESAASATDHERDRLRQSVTIDLGESPVWVEVDAARLEQVLSNLLANASKFTPDGGAVALRVARETADDGAPYAAVRVSDNGKGIDAGMVSRIFGLFVQGEQPYDRMRSGVGIGLTLARRLVDLHGGSLDVTSDGEGKGSEFVVRLPLAPRSAAPVDVPRRRPSPGPPRRVLLVDDNLDALEGMATCLTRAGHDVRLARSGREALAAAASFGPEVVLLDIGLPDIDGYSVARSLRSGNGGAEMLLVALTGYGRDEDIGRAREAGFDGHLAKPAEPERVLATIASGFSRPKPSG